MIPVRAHISTLSVYKLLNYYGITILIAVNNPDVYIILQY